MATLISFDDDEPRNHSLPNATDSFSFPPLSQTPLPAPAGLSPVSSIKEMPEKENVPQRKPRLPEPKERHIGLDLVKFQQGIDYLTTKQAQLTKIETGGLEANLDELSAEMERIVENEAKAIKSRAVWSVLSIVAHYISSVGMIVLGSACGGVPAALLIAAGVIGIGSRLAQDTHFLQAAIAWYTKSEELQKKIAYNIDMSLFFLQISLITAGSLLAWQTGALAAAQINGFLIKKKAASIITGASQAMSVGGKFGMAYYDKKISNMLAAKREINAHTTINNQNKQQAGAQIIKFLESHQTCTDVIIRANQALGIPQD